MWNNQDNQQQQGYGAPPPFPNFPNPGGFAPPPGAPPSGYHTGYNPSYAPPSYGTPPPPPAGFAPPPGPPPAGFDFPQGPQGGYGSTPPPPHGGPAGFPSPSGLPPGGYAPSPGGPPPPPPRHDSSDRGFPGASWRQKLNQYTPPGMSFPGQGQGQVQTPPPPPPAGTPGGGYRPDYSAPHMPPTQVQHYGPQTQGPHHKTTQPFFQYSQCNGKKKALLIGINYFGQQRELRGCINDVKNVKNFLLGHWGYKEGDIVVLTDDQTDPRKKPTTANIIQAMTWLVSGAMPNDSLFFHYSGHGGQTKDTDGDEGDGYDEVIYPVDHKQNGHIVDDVMHEIMVKPLPAGCRLTAIFDSCHSGSALDLPYIYSTEGKIKEPNLALEAGQGLLSAVSSYARGDIGGVFKSAIGIVKTATGSNQKADKISKATRTSPADVISFSGCKDSQTSADTHEGGQATGAMSYAFITVLTSKHQQTYQELLVNVRDILRSKYSQKPQLASSHPMDTNIYFLC